MAFTKPAGPHAIGSVTHEIVDPSRPTHIGSTTTGRRIIIKVWYPALRGCSIRSELLWPEVRASPQAPLPLRLLLKCLRVRTCTQPRAPFTPDPISSTLVIYNHGLVSFPSENTSLCEDLASHGCVVLSVSHAEHYAELQALNRGQSSEKNERDAALMQRLNKASKAEKAGLAMELYQTSANTNRLVIERAYDTSYVLNRADEVLAQIPDRGPAVPKVSSASLVGFSVGGAVATETASSDTRVRAVVNLDGGMYGSHCSTRVSQPYLMAYSSANDGINDRLLPMQATRMTLPSSTHLNYHDIAMLLPFLRFAGALGSSSPRAGIEERNRLVRRFLLSAGQAS